MPENKGCTSCKQLHRRAQKAEGEVMKLRAQLAEKRSTWDSGERRAEASERDRQMAALEPFWPVAGCYSGNGSEQ
jgi:hypothetical protein